MSALANTPALVSVDEYLRRTDRPNCEYVDGVLRAKAMPTKLHSLLQYALVGLLRSFGLEAVQEVTVRISPSKYLVPDVIAAPRIQDPYPTEAVLLCVEILSPEDRVGAALAKCEEYHAWGVPFCWVIEPLKQTGWQYNKGGEPVHMERGGSLSVHADNGELTVNLSQLFAALPR